MMKSWLTFTLYVVAVIGVTAYAEPSQPTGELAGRPMPQLEFGDEPAETGRVPQLPPQTPLAGDWLRGAGIMPGLTLKVANLANISGGLSRGLVGMGLIDAHVGIDGEKGIGISGLSAFVSVISAFGGHPCSLVGDAQGVCNIAAVHQIKFFQAWLEQEFSGGDVTLRAGLYDLNSEFYATASSTPFLNSAHGIGTDFAQSGLNGPSIYPNTALALRLSIRWSDLLSSRIAVLDGVPEDPDRPTECVIRISRREGVLGVAEIDCETLGILPGKAGLGIWGYSSRFASVLDDAAEPEATLANAGTYAFAEGTVDFLGVPLSCFVRGGLASGRVNRFGGFLGYGATVTGVIPSRGDDLLGFAVATAFTGQPWQARKEGIGGHCASGEAAYELVYVARFSNWLSGTFDWQHIVHPEADLEISHADVLMIGFMVDLN